MKKTDVNYSLYLVTDSTSAILGDKDICDVVGEALQGGVGIVQYRDKTSDTGALIATARKLHKITEAFNVPLLINDRVDVALAVGCEGVHLGQDDMSELTSSTPLVITLIECRHRRGEETVRTGCNNWRHSEHSGRGSEGMQGEC